MYKRQAVNRLLKSEGLEHAVWSAGIHYNTDNLHAVSYTHLDVYKRQVILFPDSVLYVALQIK